MDNIRLFRYAFQLLKTIIDAENAAPRAGRGRPQANLRTIFFGLFCMLKNGWTYRQVPRRYGARSTLNKYLLEWARRGYFEALFNFLVAQGYEADAINLKVLIVDATERAVQGLAGGAAGIGYKNKSKRAIKITAMIDLNGNPISLDLSSAENHDVKRLQAVAEAVEQDDPKSSPVVILADRGYVSSTEATLCSQRGELLLVPKKANQKEPHLPQVEALLKNRYKVECFFERLFNFKRLAFVYDKTKDAYAGWLYMAVTCIIISSLFSS